MMLPDDDLLFVRCERARRMHALALGFAHARRALRAEMTADLKEHRAWLADEVLKLKIELIEARAEIERLRAITVAVDMTRDGRALN